MSILKDEIPPRGLRTSGILELPEPRQDERDPGGARILPYVIVATLERFEAGTFPPEYVQYLVAAVDRIRARDPEAPEVILAAYRAGFADGLHVGAERSKQD